MPEPVGLRREERDEEVSGVGQPRTLVVDRDLQRAIDLLPVERHLPRGVFERRVNGVADDIDQQLLELIGVSDDSGRLVPEHDDRQPVLEFRDAVDEPLHVGCPWSAAWAAAPAARTTAGNDRADPERVSIRLRPSWISSARGSSGTRDSMRLMLCAMDLIGVSELLISCDSTRTMRCQACLLLLAQRTTEVGEHQQLMRLALAPEGRCAATRAGR